MGSCPSPTSKSSWSVPGSFSSSKVFPTANAARSGAEEEVDSSDSDKHAKDKGQKRQRDLRQRRRARLRIPIDEMTERVHCSGTSNFLELRSKHLESLESFLPWNTRNIALLKFDKYRDTTLTLSDEPHLLPTTSRLFLLRSGGRARYTASTEVRESVAQAVPFLPSEPPDLASLVRDRRGDDAAWSRHVVWDRAFIGRVFLATVESPGTHTGQPTISVRRPDQPFFQTDSHAFASHARFRWVLASRAGSSRLEMLPKTWEMGDAGQPREIREARSLERHTAATLLQRKNHSLVCERDLEAYFGKARRVRVRRIWAVISELLGEVSCNSLVASSYDSSLRTEASCGMTGLSLFVLAKAPSL